MCWCSTLESWRLAQLCALVTCFRNIQRVHFSGIWLGSELIDATPPCICNHPASASCHLCHTACTEIACQLEKGKKEKKIKHEFYEKPSVILGCQELHVIYLTGDCDKLDSTLQAWM